MKKIYSLILTLFLSVSAFAAGHTVTTSLTNVTCNGICNGSITASVSGGVGPFTYDWAPGAPVGDGTNAITNLCPGSYTITVTDNSDMSTAIATVVITEPSMLSMPASTTTNICYGGCATLSASAIGGTAPYTYFWNSSSFLSSPTIANPTCCPPTSMTYTISVTDMNGCVANAVRTVLFNTPITSGITSTNTTGCATCDGTATSAPTGGSSPYLYNWSTGATTPAVVSNCAGTYSVTITDSNGCTITDSTTVFANNDVSANFTMVPDSTNAFNFFAFNSSTGAGLNYYWDFGGMGSSTSENPSFLFSAPGTYNIHLELYSFLCGTDTLDQPLVVTGTPLSCLALFNIADDTLNPDPNAHYVYNLSFGSTLTYLWDFGDGTTSTSMTPSHVYSGAGPYLLCLSVDNGAGCTDMFCDSLISADSLNRSSGIMQLTVYDISPFQGLTTGITDHTNAASISVSPNPFNDVTVFEIKSNKTEIYSFELTDVLGKKVKSISGITEKQFEISREGLQNGIYFYKVYALESVVGIGKIIIK